LIDSDAVDKDEFRKMEIEAKKNKRETWIKAYVMDINP